MAAPPETAKHFMLKDVKTSEKDMNPYVAMPGNSLSLRKPNDSTMLLYLALLILPALLTGIFLLRRSKKEGNKPQRTAGLILLILGILIALFCTAAFLLLHFALSSHVPVGL